MKQKFEIELEINVYLKQGYTEREISNHIYDLLYVGGGGFFKVISVKEIK